MNMGINRNIVECKGRFYLCNYLPGLVLIETLWNVKMLQGQMVDGIDTVLIETLWNVKR